ncbi:hypothetical protein PIROE2DRAFT_62535 [Piromyces sp. E2]|nr:hypothetical protein PIROE2DRAFT_62535 [Piromyces sp. E2]|eukprot:OUM61401.1 hypothetical protein PIROE2DRAFT_62535 [Piromyces sp. E2]
MDMHDPNSMNISDAYSFCTQLSEIVDRKDEIGFTIIFNPEELDENNYNALVNNLNSLAEKQLYYAYINCKDDVDFQKNKRLIFLYLLVARLILGKFPNETLLRKYGYYEYFNDLIKAIKQDLILRQQGYMKAFVNNETQIIYLSKKDPFPNPFRSSYN